MTQMNKASAAQQVQSITAQLNAVLLRKDMLTEQLKAADEESKALRNLMAGVDIGQKLAAEIVEEKAKAVAKAADKVVEATK